MLETPQLLTPREYIGRVRSGKRGLSGTQQAWLPGGQTGSNHLNLMRVHFIDISKSFKHQRKRQTQIKNCDTERPQGISPRPKPSLCNEGPFPGVWHFVSYQFTSK
jgi:hypothetical protein